MGQCSTVAAALRVLWWAYGTQPSLRSPLVRGRVLVCNVVLRTIVLPIFSLFCRVSSLLLIIISLLFTLCSHVDKDEWMWLCLVLHTPARGLWSAHSGLGRASWDSLRCGWLPTQGHGGSVVALAGSLVTAIFTHRLLVGLLCNCCMEHHRNR